MPIKSPRCFAATFSLMMLVSGCAVGPDFHRPNPPDVKGYTTQPLTATASSPGVAGGEEQRFVENMHIPQQWWTLFESPPLNALIEKALKANPTIDAAKATLRQAHENVAAQKGLYFPTIQANGLATRQKDATGTISPTLNSGASTFTLYTAQAAVSFIPDVFGGKRRQVESLTAQAEFQRFQLEAAYLALTSNVAAAAFQEASLRSQIASTQKIIEIATRILDLQRKHLALGYVAGLDVAAQEAALAQVQTTLPPLEKQLAQTRDSIAALVGRFPSEELEEKFDLGAMRLPRELPVSLPSRLVEQRPDLRAAEAQLHSASAQVGVAIADMLPQITLSGNAGGSSTQLSQLFVPGNTFWTLGTSLTQTLFDAGTLLHRKRAAEAGLDQAAAQYRSTVLNAFQNVADTLHALQSDADGLKAAVAAEQAAKRSLDLIRGQLELGSANYLALLAAEQTYQQALITLAQAQANRFSDTAALFMALGGGWWNQTENAYQASN